MILLKLSLKTQDIDCDLTTENCCLTRILKLFFLITLGDSAFVAATPKLWNDLPLEIGMTKSVDTLKTRLLVKLFILSYCRFT